MLPRELAIELAQNLAVALLVTLVWDIRWGIIVYLAAYYLHVTVMKLCKALE